MKIRNAVLAFFLTFSCSGYSQKEIPLYSGKIPNSKDVIDQEEIVFNKEVDTLAYKVSRPTLTIFLPPEGKANGTAVVICPGGGYHVLLMTREGCDIAREFNKLGIAAFVLKYRLPDDKIMPDKSIGPLQDAQRAISLVRERAAEWNIKSDRIGIMGFSAGGHLAATAGTHFEHALTEDKTGISIRPDFMILVYPVISLSDSLGHIGSREYLLGKNPSEKQIRYFSNELQVTKTTPPAFIILAGDDTVVKPENSFRFYNALRMNGVASEMHIYAAGEHGFLKTPPFEEWFGRCAFWLNCNGWIM
ncbi:MAG: alpha/beta hydrolase [Bacteroidales bacterium]|nr:alpha/beta hydrolase [Bacteroidales bacterium]